MLFRVQMDINETKWNISIVNVCTNSLKGDLERYHEAVTSNWLWKRLGLGQWWDGVKGINTALLSYKKNLLVDYPQNKK